MIREAIEKISKAAKDLFNFSLKQETVSQYQPDPNNKYACLFTCYYMFLRTVSGYKKSWEEYKKACIAAGALREDFYVLDHAKMLRAGGDATHTPKKITANMVQEIVQSVLTGRPVICSLNGEHWVSIDGWTMRDNEMLFTIDDPARKEDVFCTWELRPFSFTANGKKTYQLKRNSATKREITSIFVMQRQHEQQR